MADQQQEVEDPPLSEQAQAQQEATTQESTTTNISNQTEDQFKCNICFNTASDAVVTLCGHLFCWPCLYTWLHFHSKYKECPVCKGAASENRVIPIYSWGPCKEGLHVQQVNNTNIPPRPAGRRVENDRQRRHRYHAERSERRSSAPVPSDVNNNSSNNSHGSNATLIDLNEAMFRDAQQTLHHNPDYALIGRETRASWLERLRAMREERLAWPVAFVHGLTSRELLQQRRLARGAEISPRLIGVSDSPMPSPMHEANNDITVQAAVYSQSGLAQQGLPTLTMGLNHHHGHHLHHHHAGHHHQHHHAGHQQMVSATLSPNMSNSSHTTQYLSTMSSILSSMEVFAKALELSTSASYSQKSTSSFSSSSSTSAPSVAAPLASMPPSQFLRVFSVPDEEQVLWQSAMRGLLMKMERLMGQLQSIQPMKSSANLADHNTAPISMNDQHMSHNQWMSTPDIGGPATGASSSTNNNGNGSPSNSHNASNSSPSNIISMNNLRLPYQHYHHHHLHHHHLDGSVTDRGHHMSNHLLLERTTASNTANMMINNTSHFDINAGIGSAHQAAAHCSRNPSVFTLPSEGTSRELEHPSTGCKSRKRWDVTRTQC